MNTCCLFVKPEFGYHRRVEPFTHIHACAGLTRPDFFLFVSPVTQDYACMCKHTCTLYVCKVRPPILYSRITKFSKINTWSYYQNTWQNCCWEHFKKLIFFSSVIILPYTGKFWCGKNWWIWQIVSYLPSPIFTDAPRICTDCSLFTKFFLNLYCWSKFFPAKFFPCTVYICPILRYFQQNGYDLPAGFFYALLNILLVTRRRSFHRIKSWTRWWLI